MHFSQYSKFKFHFRTNLLKCLNTNNSILSLKPLVYSHIHLLAILKFNFL